MTENGQAKMLVSAPAREVAETVWSRQTGQLETKPHWNQFLLETALAQALYSSLMSQENCLSRIIIGPKSASEWMPAALGLMVSDTVVEVWECSKPDCSAYHGLLRSKTVDLFTMKFGEEGEEINDIVMEADLPKDAVGEDYAALINGYQYVDGREGADEAHQDS